MNYLIALFSILLFCQNIYGQIEISFDFESGELVPIWNDDGGDYLKTVVDDVSVLGDHSLELGGIETGNSHSDGVSTTFTHFQPSYIRWYVKSGEVEYSSSGYVVIGPQFNNGMNSLVLSYISSNKIWFAQDGVSSYTLPVQNDTWYKIELRNIDWTNRNYDLYIDDDLKKTSFRFRDQNVENVSSIKLYNYLGSATSNIDAISLYTDCNESPETSAIIGNPNPAPYTMFPYIVESIADSNFEWTVSGGSIASETENIVNVLWGADGMGNICVIETNQAGCSGEQICFNNSNSVLQTTPPEPTVLPNPATDQIVLSNIDLQNVTQFSLFNADGKLVKRRLEPSSKFLDIVDLRAGMYFYQYLIEGNYKSGKLIIK